MEEFESIPIYFNVFGGENLVVYESIPIYFNLFGDENLAEIVTDLVLTGTLFYIWGKDDTTVSAPKTAIGLKLEYFGT